MLTSQFQGHVVALAIFHHAQPHQSGVEIDWRTPLLVYPVGVTIASDNDNEEPASA